MARFKPLPPAEILRERFAYDPKTGSLTWRVHTPRSTKHAGDPAVCRHKSGYHVVTIAKSQYLAHRIIWKIVTGKDPVETIDHKNGDRLDHRWANLRPATLTEQNRNRGRQRNNSSGIVGVFWNNGRWEARAKKDGIQYYFGRFATIEEATAARGVGTRRLFGDFYRH